MPRYATDAVGLGLFIVAALLVYPRLAEWRERRHGVKLHSSRRLPDAGARAALTTQGLLAGILYLAFGGAGWSQESVGLRSAFPTTAGLLFGAGAYSVLWLLYRFFLAQFAILPAVRRAAFRANAALWPRRRAAKISAALAFCVLNPITEELLMRGILIHQWSILAGSAALPILAGLLFNALLHSYQGWRVQAWHALYFFLAVGLLYSPAGLAGAIGAHATADSFPILTLRQQARSIRTSRHSAPSPPTA